MANKKGPPPPVLPGMFDVPTSVSLSRVVPPDVAGAVRQTEKQAKYHRALLVYRQTSREAWASVALDLPDVDVMILSEIRARRGATADAVEIATGLKHQTVSAQIRHMVEAGLLRPSGRYDATSSGRRAIVWEIAAD